MLYPGTTMIILQRRDRSGSDVTTTSVVGLAAVGTEYVGAVGQKSSSEQTGVTFVTGETVCMPVAVVERDKLGSVHPCNS